ncbi:nitroreductase family protein [Jannaschia seohaensis]|uniref:Putative NAD(P)H nitroreductase n=1 Tax=Jannaschia seohaensis TaxID=475081 RepID=A0A2Y9B2F3_9RHOB|nr:nitroreductase [Jannaschia seohaensis]PWJ14413.1 nitroreductase [Jannaschia seohaensis]SSA50135.1 Nitroreductase [Jannaschia seohaensis]
MTEITPLAPRPEVLDFLATRRSRPAKTLRAPGPDRAALTPLLATAMRVPDHGKLEPWRLIVLEGAALARLAALTGRLGAEQGRDPEKLPKSQAMFADAPLIVAVVSSPQASDKIPEVEQTLSAGALCLSLVNAAQAAGWGANWLTGWMALDRDFLTEGLALAPTEWVAGWIVIGTESAVPPERPRPDVAAKTEWRSA